MAIANNHHYLGLTKRADRQRAYLSDPKTPDRIDAIIDRIGRERGWPCVSEIETWPLPNYWAGVSVENQEWADKRIPDLFATPAAIRWISAEPLLGPINIRAFVDRGAPTRLDWIVCGGESGPGSRQFSREWATQIVAECAASETPCFVKQVGANYVDAIDGVGGAQANPDPQIVPSIRKLTDRKGGDPEEWPEYLRVREFPRGVPR